MIVRRRGSTPGRDSRVFDRNRDGCVATVTGRYPRRLHEAFVGVGCVVIREYLSRDEVACVRRVSAALGAVARDLLSNAGRSTERSTASGLLAVPESTDPLRLCRFEYLLASSPALRRLSSNRIEVTVSTAAGELFVPFKDKQNEKAPAGGAFGAHQDAAAYRHFGPSYHVTAMIAIDSCTVANGCLEIAVEYRRQVAATPEDVVEPIGGRPLLRHAVGGPMNGDIAPEAQRKLTWTPIELSTRDMLLFDSFVPHRSAANQSADSRRAMFLTYNAAREGDWYERYYAAKRSAPDHPAFHVSTPTLHRDTRRSHSRG